MKMPNKVIKIYSIFRKNEGIVGFGVMAIALYKAPVAKFQAHQGIVIFLRILPGLA